ncbi:MAG: M14-type cytosolic carboxypeptidase [Rhodospirillaceae bacterium]
MLTVSAAFDGGNIIVDAIDQATAKIDLQVRADNQADFKQWFYFRLAGGRDRDCTLALSNAGACSYPKGWEDYAVVASHDRQTWFRVPTDYHNGVLTFRYTPPVDAVYFAYFAPYSTERHGDLIAGAVAQPHVHLEIPGQTLDGRDMEILRFGEPAVGRKNLWFIARQHPGETMAEWFMEGLVKQLADQHDAVAAGLLAEAVCYVVPNMNPDGSARGNLRTNAAGANLNREWRDGSLETAPEVFHIRRRMAETGVDFCLDVHGDEGLPVNFIAGYEGIPALGAAHLAVLDDYRQLLATISPDFQTERGYPKTSPGRADLRICTSYLADRFRCLSMTLEMPFKDHQPRPDRHFGWSPARAQQLAAAVLNASYQMHPRFGKFEREET